MNKFALLILLCGVLTAGVLAQTTEFTYQGSLRDGASPANGNYDFQFRLWDALTAGTQHPTIVTLPNVVVSNGSFTVKLDFFSPLVGAFPGADRFLEIRVKNAGGLTYTTLSPRQKISGEPYAQKSLNSDTATNSTQLGGIAANQYLTTTNGGTAFIRNSTSQQASSNFNVSGDGTVGGTLTAGTLSASSGFNIDTTPVFSIAGVLNTFIGANAGTSNTGTNNAFVGSSAGAANSSGSNNAFFGSFSGNANTTGSSNAFFGRLAGSSNTTGSSNSFFGANSGDSNTTGFSNSFFGRSAGANNTTGARNAFFGLNAGVLNSTGDQNTFFGANAGVANTTAANNSFFGYASGQSNSTGVDNSFFGSSAGQANTTGQLNAFFGVNSGDSNTTGIGNSFFGANTGTANSTGDSNSFFGRSAGTSNTIANGNSFFGYVAGQFNTTGASNSFFGANAGDSNISGSNNSFFGKSAGASNTSAGNNSFFGASSGSLNTTGVSNSFFGSFAGTANTTGIDNSFFGKQAGDSNTTGGLNTFVGVLAGAANTTGGNNTFVGTNAGDTNTTGSSNTYVGNGARGSAGLFNATAIGAGATVTASRTVVLGTSSDEVDIPGNITGAGDMNMTGRFFDFGFAGDISQNVITLYGHTFIFDDSIIHGDLTVDGTITGSNFSSRGISRTTIDNPLDPVNKNLTLSTIQSPDLVNIYSGNAATDANGEGVVTLPAYVEALNNDFRYQLTVIGQFAQAIVLEKIKGNQFKIKTDKPSVEVSWQVTGVRKDAAAEKNRVPVEQDKTESERGKFLDTPPTRPARKLPVGNN